MTISSASYLSVSFSVFSFLSIAFPSFLLAMSPAVVDQNPPPFITAEPLPENILEWHYVLHGLPNDCPYHGGYYHGKLVFPPTYPMKPPAIYMITPSGRFKENTKLCLSISDFHPDTWNPAWSVETVLKGLLSFMLEDTPTAGSIITSTAEKESLAKRSLIHNLQNKVFCDLFPEIAEEIREVLRRKLEEKKTAAETQPSVEDNKPPEFSTRALAILAGTLVPAVALILYYIVNTAP
eukprot:m.100000 g.100000  ORF g.100000 m.100000 type:complete len:237 (+) comp14921_c1_seq2:56-766(+)